MHKKIRNRILLLNMTMVSAVVIVAFAAIFAMTYVRVENENREKLMYGSISRALVSGRHFVQGNVFRAEPGTDGSAISGFTRLISPDAGLSFSLLMDSEGNVIEINSMVELPGEAYAQAAAEVMIASGGNSSIVLEDRVWQYASFPITIQYTDTTGVSFTVFEGYSNVRFLDITDSIQTLRSLALMLSGLTVVILAAFYFISRFFANRAIRPMIEAWDKQGRFVADASHELKTPLSIINANCGVLYANLEETVESQIRWIDNILRAADRMAGFAGSLLSLARMEDAQLALQTLPFDMSAVVTDAVQEMEAAALSKDVRIIRRIEADIMIENDQERVRQVLSNLLDNAIKYTESGGEITITLKKEKRYVSCAVRNSGGGISAEELPRLFDRFYRGDPARSSENHGYGLGLAIAKAAAERLGAKLSAESSPGEYTEFTLSLISK